MVIYDLAQWSSKQLFHSFIQNTHYRQCITGNVAQNATGGGHGIRVVIMWLGLHIYYSLLGYSYSVTTFHTQHEL